MDLDGLRLTGDRWDADSAKKPSSPPNSSSRLPGCARGRSSATAATSATAAHAPATTAPPPTRRRVAPKTRHRRTTRLCFRVQRPSWRLEPSFARHALARGCSFAYKQPPLFLRGDSAFQAFVRRGRYRIANEARAGRGPRDLRLAARSHRACWGRGGGAARLAAFCSTLLLAWSCRQRGEEKTRIVRSLRRERA